MNIKKKLVKIPPPDRNLNYWHEKKMNKYIIKSFGYLTIILTIAFLLKFVLYRYDILNLELSRKFCSVEIYPIAEIEALRTKKVNVKEEKNIITENKLSVNPLEIENEIKRISKEECGKRKLGDFCQKDLLAIAYTEHRDLNCDRKGDGGKSVGCYQIHLGYHPEVTVEQAKDLKFSIAWTLNRLVANKYPVKRSIAVMKHNGTPWTKKTLAYLKSVNSYKN
jgi:hypothetical protein